MAPQQQTRPFDPDPGGPQGVSREKSLAPAGRLHNLVCEHPDFEVISEPTPGLCCFRYVPNGLSERKEEPGVQTLLDRLNLEIVEAVRRGGRDIVAATSVGGRAAIRVSICSPRTTVEDVDAAFESVARWGRLLSKTHPDCHGKPAETEAL